MKPVITDPAPGDRARRLARIGACLARMARAAVAEAPPAGVQSPPRRRTRRRAA